MQQRVQERIALIYDIAHGAQMEGKGIKEYVTGLERAVGLQRQGGSSADFLRDIGGGI